jgi:hypothetical protein
MRASFTVVGVHATPARSVFRIKAGKPVPIELVIRLVITAEAPAVESASRMLTFPFKVTGS